MGVYTEPRRRITRPRQGRRVPVIHSGWWYVTPDGRSLAFWSVQEIETLLRYWR